jgi:chaperonin GroEL (HSP60 family)
MSKMIAFEQDAREAMRRGVHKPAKTVRSTLGPGGHNVIIQKSYGSPVVTRDGVTVTKEIDLDDPYENMDARMVREVASKTNDVGGDGTTTATVLAEAIFNEGLRAVVAGTNPIGMKRGIEHAVEDIVANLDSMSKSVDGRRDMEHVARISGNQDSKVGQLVSDAMEKVGKDGVVTIDEGKSLETEVSATLGQTLKFFFLATEREPLGEPGHLAVDKQTEKMPVIGHDAITKKVKLVTSHRFGQHTFNGFVIPVLEKQLVSPIGAVEHVINATRLVGTLRSAHND